MPGLGLALNTDYATDDNDPFSSAGRLPAPALTPEASVPTADNPAALGLSPAPVQREPLPAQTATLPPAATAAAAPAAPQTARQAPLIDFKKDPVGALGLIFSNVAAGLQGKELPSERLRAQIEAEKKAEINSLAVSTTAMDHILSRADKLPAEQRAAFLEAAGNRWEQSSPGFKAMLNAASKAGAEDRRLLAAFPSHAEWFANAGITDPKAITQFLKSPEIMKSVDAEIDRVNLPVVQQKFREMEAVLDKVTPEWREKYWRPDPNAPMGGWLAGITVDDLAGMSAKAGPRLGFTPSQQATIERHSDKFFLPTTAATAAQQAGMTTRAQEQARLETEKPTTSLITNGDKQQLVVHDRNGRVINRVDVGEATSLDKTAVKLINKVASGENLTESEQKAWDMYRNTPEIQSLMRGYMKPGSGAATGPSGGTKLEGVAGLGTDSAPYAPKTKDEFSKIPSGMKYLNPADGKVYSKK